MPDAPLVLAFDTSAAHCAAALLSGDQVLAQRVEDMARGQAERLLALCQDVLQDQNLTLQDLTAIGVGIGPGNFTGIRISVAAARGLALGLDVPAIGVSAFDALRYGIQGPCACAVDARRGQVFFQAFDQDTQSTPALIDSHALPAFEGPLIGAGGRSPEFPTAVAIAQCARLRLDRKSPPPSPLYLRPADAAPARDVAPVILA